ncbi:hypothetical protein Q6247_27010, partial [Klebsiella pneumoniae]
YYFYLSSVILGRGWGISFTYGKFIRDAETPSTIRADRDIKKTCPVDHNSRQICLIWYRNQRIYDLLITWLIRMDYLK